MCIIFPTFNVNYLLSFEQKTGEPVTPVLEYAHTIFLCPFGVGTYCYYTMYYSSTATTNGDKNNRQTGKTYNVAYKTTA